MTPQQRDVFFPLPKRRNIERNHIETVKQVLAEITPGDFFFQILVRGRDDAGINRDRLISSYRREALFIQGAQHLRLRLEAHIPHFVEKKRPAVRLLKFAFFIAGRAWE